MIKKLKKDSPEAKLAEFLLEQRLITEELIERALEYRQAMGGISVKCLSEKGLISEDDLAFGLSQQFNVPLLSSKTGAIRPAEDQSLEKFVSKHFALRNMIIPLSRDGSTLTCVMFDPFRFYAH